MGIWDNTSAYSIWDDTINSNKPVEWNANTNSSIGTAISNNINDKPVLGAIGGAINNLINSGTSGFNWGSFGKNLLGNINFGGSTQEEAPRVNFQPTMAQPGYVNTNFQNQQSNIAKNNLYDYLTR